MSKDLSRRNLPDIARPTDRTLASNQAETYCQRRTMLTGMGQDSNSRWAERPVAVSWTGMLPGVVELCAGCAPGHRLVTVL